MEENAFVGLEAKLQVQVAEVRAGPWHCSYLCCHCVAMTVGLAFSFCSWFDLCT